MIDSRNITKPKVKTLQLLQLPSLDKFIKANLDIVTKYLSSKPTRRTYTFNIKYDYNVAINNMVDQVYISNAPRDASYDEPYLADFIVVCSLDNYSIKEWATRQLTIYYKYLTVLQQVNTDLLPTPENINLVNSAINHGEQFFSPRAYIDWIIPELNNLPENCNINFEYIKHDRNYFANQIITQPAWEENFAKNTVLQKIVYQVLSLYNTETPRNTPAIGLLLDRLTGLKHDYKCAQLANSYSLGFQ